ncbi:hypothetical protein DENSPDRAFT_502503 [Dentipellis sp. KUC8613]|nr:hypothetical protein DENSPDRAFT_502503 [Dentipellis sp. KUC8613]
MLFFSVLAGMTTLVTDNHIGRGTAVLAVVVPCSVFLLILASFSSPLLELLEPGFGLVEATRDFCQVDAVRFTDIESLPASTYAFYACGKDLGGSRRATGGQSTGKAWTWIKHLNIRCFVLASQANFHRRTSCRTRVSCLHFRIRKASMNQSSPGVPSGFLLTSRPCIRCRHSFAQSCPFGFDSALDERARFAERCLAAAYDHCQMISGQRLDSLSPTAKDLGRVENAGGAIPQSNPMPQVYSRDL